MVDKTKQEQKQQNQGGTSQQNPFKRFLTNRASMMKQHTRSNATTFTTSSTASSNRVMDAGSQEEDEELQLQQQHAPTPPVTVALSTRQDLVLELLQAGAYQEALEMTEAALPQCPLTQRSLLLYYSLMAHLELSTEPNDDHDRQAEQIWKRLHQVDFTDMVALSLPTASSIKLVDFLCRKEEWKLALRLARDSSTGEVDTETLGEIHYQVGTSPATPLEDAVECLEQAFSLMTCKQAAYTALLQALAANQEFTKANHIHNAYLETLVSVEDRSMARLDLAECYITEHRHDAGLQIIQQGLEETSNALPLLHAKAELLFQMGFRKEAIALYDSMLLPTEGSIEQARILCALSKIYLRLKIPDQALQYCKRELKLTKRVVGKNDPEVARIYSDLAHLYDTMCDYPNAISYYTKAVDVMTKALNRLKGLCLHSNNEHDLEQYDAQMAELRQGMYETKKLLGKVHYKTGNWTSAVDVTGMNA
jgi:tetratricopeptide (TPR) repeat protein